MSKIKNLKYSLNLFLLATTIGLTSVGCSKFNDTEVVIETQSEDETYIEITISWGDNLTNIANKYNTTVERLCDLNNIENPDKICVGDVIKVPVKKVMDTDTYIVQVGDNLTNIANKYGITLNELLSLNTQISNPDSIKIGEKINVPKIEYNSDYVSYVVKVNDSIYGLCYAFDMDPDEFLSINNIDLDHIMHPGDRVLVKADNIYQKHEVKYGDTLDNIAKKFNVTVEDIMILNNLISKDLEVGQVIYIPDSIKTDTNIVDNEPVTLNPIGYDENQISQTIDIDINNWNNLIKEQGYVTGIDISKHQDAVNFDMIYKNNPEIDFVFIRSFNFFRRDTVDVKFEENCRIAVENGVAVGTYFWPTCETIEKTRRETQIVIDKLKSLEEKGIYMTMPIALDVENTDKGTELIRRLKAEDKTTLECMKLTINMLKDAGYYVIFYSNDTLITELRNQYEDHEDPTLNSKDGIFGLDAWVARYYSNNPVSISDKNVIVQVPKYTNKIGVRQYSQYGRVKGYENDIDLNRAYNNYPQLMYDYGLNHLDEIEKEEVLSLIK